MQRSFVFALKERLSNIIDVDHIDFNKLYEELLAFFTENQNDFIRRRHKELQNQGYKNEEIFPLIVNEVKKYLFKGQDLSQRQIKRIIYKEK